MKKISVLLFLAFLSDFSHAQIIEPIKWAFDSRQNGNEIDLIFKVNIENGWHLYDTYLPEGGPIATAVIYEDSTLFEFVGDLEKNPAPEEHFDNTFKLTLRYFSLQAA